MRDWAQAEQAARAALATRESTAGLADSGFTRIDGSLSNFAWHAIAGQQQAFVRLAREGTEALGADLQAEAEILRQVSAAGIAPPVLRCDPSQRLLVTRWIAPFTAELDTGATAVVTAVAQVLARLHQLTVPADLRQIRFDNQARMLRASSPTTATASNLQAAASDVFAQLDDRPVAKLLCHHDVHAGNIVIDTDERLWLVDWEYAGLNDPHFDLASFASQCALPVAAVRVFCAAYSEAGGSVDEGRLELARWAFDYVQSLWYRRLTDSAEAVQGLRQADRFERSLLERASVLLRCNNRRFDQ